MAPNEHGATPADPLTTHLSDDEPAPVLDRALSKEIEPDLTFPQCLLFNKLGFGVAVKWAGLSACNAFRPGGLSAKIVNDNHEWLVYQSQCGIQNALAPPLQLNLAFHDEAHELSRILPCPCAKYIRILPQLGRYFPDGSDIKCPFAVVVRVGIDALNVVYLSCSAFWQLGPAFPEGKLHASSFGSAAERQMCNCGMETTLGRCRGADWAACLHGDGVGASCSTTGKTIS